MAGSRLNLTFLDHSGESSRSFFQGASIGAANFDAQIALQDALETAVNAITLCTIHKRTRVASEVRLSATLPDAGANRESKWLVVYRDNVTLEPYRLEIPGADPALLQDNSDYMDLESVAGAAFKTAFEDYVKQGEVVDNAVTIEYVKMVGRNL